MIVFDKQLSEDLYILSVLPHPNQSSRNSCQDMLKINFIVVLLKVKCEGTLILKLKCQRLNWVKGVKDEMVIDIIIAYRIGSISTWL